MTRRPWVLRQWRSEIEKAIYEQTTISPPLWFEAPQELRKWIRREVRRRVRAWVDEKVLTELRGRVLA